ncbi:hypothetical protein RhiirA4_430758 [Rhizophagus irregularis]|uniref:Uncharacterized protein n=1 Tax=Rhizophagus irregularis TaxID=588596 RepID=A0A2I1HM10_9GLOM|nr:hypothetical protein RhiirA4_430758 [Rhizophagus irregularis]
MSAITTKFVTDHQLTNEMSIEEFSQYAPEMRDLLGDDREKRRQTRNCLQKGYKFSKGQAFALIPDQRIERLRRKLQILNAPEKIISATKIPEITRISNKIQQERTEQRKNEGLHYLDHFSLESLEHHNRVADRKNKPSPNTSKDKKASNQDDSTQALFDYVTEDTRAPVTSTSGTSKTSKRPELVIGKPETIELPESNKPISKNMNTPLKEIPANSSNPNELSSAILLARAQ